MTYPIAMIPYINMAPYREAGVPSGCSFVPLVPSVSVRALKSGQVMAAAVPAGALPELGEQVQMVGQFGIAAREESMSVLLFSNRPFEELDRSADLRITSESTSSVRLLGILLSLNRECPSGSEDGGGRPRGELVIGDKALIGLHRWKQGRAHGPDDARLQNHAHVHDLADRWFSLTGLPFVFARWVVRADAPEACKEALFEWLGSFRRLEERLVQMAVPKIVRDSGLPKEYVSRYFSAIRRTLDAEDLAGQARFLEMLHEMGEASAPRLGMTTANVA